MSLKAEPFKDLAIRRFREADLKADLPLMRCQSRSIMGPKDRQMKEKHAEAPAVPHSIDRLTLIAAPTLRARVSGTKVCRRRAELPRAPASRAAPAG